MATTSAPKLENFLGSEATGTPHYACCSATETMPLSLDSMFYHHQQNQVQQQHPQELHHPQHLSYYSSTLRNHDVMLQQGSKQSQTSADSNILHVTNNMAPEDGLKSWVLRNFPASHSHAQESKMMVPVVEENNEGESGSNIGSVAPYGDLHSLSLSMSPSSQSSCVTSSQRTSPAVIDSVAMMDTKKRGPEKFEQQKQIVHRKSIDTFGQRTSQYRGVTRLVLFLFLLLTLH